MMLYSWIAWFCVMCELVVLTDENRTVFRWKPVGARTADGGPQMFRMRLGYIPWFRRGSKMVAAEYLPGTFFHVRGRLQWAPLRVALHWILRPDNMRFGLHDHPWNFWSIVLWGWYWEKFIPERLSLTEWNFCKKRERGLLSSAYHRSGYTHAIVNVRRKGCLTLIVQSSRIGSPRFRHTPSKWGFPGIGKSFDQVQDGEL